MNSVKFLMSTFCAVAFIFAPYNHVISASAEACKDVEFIFARGSGAPLGGADNTAWVGSLEPMIRESSLSYNFYELGTTSYHNAKYPAIGIGFDDAKTIMNTASAIFTATHLGEFSKSVDTGVKELVGRIKDVSSRCANTKFVIGGYSQGAIVVSYALSQLDPDRLIFATTFGDPVNYLPEGEGINPPACRGVWYSDYRIYAPNCKAHAGLLGANKPYAPKGFSGKIGVWCTYDDIFCSNRVNLKDPIGDHISYISYGLYPEAAKTIREKITLVYPEAFKTETASDISRDAAILIDSSGSMEAMIEKFKATALDIAKETLNGGGNVAVFEYRDLADPFEPRLLVDFGSNYTEVERIVNNIKTSGGGDIPESALSASLHVMNTLKWHKNATKTIILLTDASYHSPDLDKVTLPQVIQRSLEIDPVNIYAITPNSTLKDSYEELTSKTGGKSLLLGDDSNIDNLIRTTILDRPEITFPLEVYQGKPSEEFTFQLNTNSENIKYEWDLDGDGVFERTTASPEIKTTFAKDMDFYLQTRATNSAGLSSTASAHVIISSSSTEPTINNITYELNGNFTHFSYQFGPDTSAVLVAVNGNLLGLTSEENFVLNDLTYPATISLIPVSNSGEQGTPITFDLSPEGGFGAEVQILAPNAGTR